MCIRDRICVLQLLQRGLDGIHQLVGQLADEAHGVGDHHIQGVADRQQAAGGVQGVKQAVVGRNGRTGELVEQRGLSRVGIALSLIHI